MLEHASKICVKYQNNCCNCPLRSTCKSKIFLSREEVNLWIDELEFKAIKNLKIEYSKNGRMLYNPFFHKRNGVKWTEEEIQYVIDWYYIAGTEEISFALDRTIASVMEKANFLRKTGKLIKPKRIKRQRRIQQNEQSNVTR